MDQAAARGWRWKAEDRQTRFPQERTLHPGRRKEAGRQPGSGERRGPCFEDKLWVEDFCGYGVDFFPKSLCKN